MCKVAGVSNSLVGHVKRCKYFSTGIVTGLVLSVNGHWGIFRHLKSELFAQLLLHIFVVNFSEASHGKLYRGIIPDY